MCSVREGAATAFLERQARLGVVESLDLSLFLHAQHQVLVRGIETEPDDVGQLLDKVLVAAELEVLSQCGLRRCCFQMHCSAVWLSPCARAILRVLQCAAWGGVVCKVASTTAHIFCGDMWQGCVPDGEHPV